MSSNYLNKQGFSCQLIPPMKPDGELTREDLASIVDETSDFTDREDR